MGTRSSYSQNSTYINCPMHHHLKYREKWESPIEGASLTFGSAIDAAIEVMLQGSQDYINMFNSRWEFQSNFGKSTKIFDNPNIMYTAKDWDSDILEQADFDLLEKWAQELNLLPVGISHAAEHITDLVKTCQKLKSNPYKRISDNEMLFLNRANWLSMKKKGQILIHAFKEQFYPKITKVIHTQERGKIEDPTTGDSLSGVIDMVIEFEGYTTPIVFDLKTSAQPYEEEKLQISGQLELYLAMLQQKGMNLTHCGYVVLNKQIQKEETSYCTKCSHVKTSSHRTCNNVINGQRCDGDWKLIKTPKPIVQVMIAEKTQAQIDATLSDHANIVSCIANNIIFRNTDKCGNYFGSDCVYKRLCSTGDTKGLVKKNNT